MGVSESVTGPLPEGGGHEDKTEKMGVYSSYSQMRRRIKLEEEAIS